MPMPNDDDFFFRSSMVRSLCLYAFRVCAIERVNVTFVVCTMYMAAAMVKCFCKN